MQQATTQQAQQAQQAQPSKQSQRSPPDLVGNSVGAYFGENERGEYVAIYVPGCDPIYLNRVPEDKRGDKSPMFRGRGGAVWLNESEGGKKYYTFRGDVFPRDIRLFFNPDA